MERDTHIAAQALAKAVIGAVPPERWQEAGAQAVELFQSIGARLGTTTNEAAHTRAAAGSGAPSPGPPPEGGSLYTVKARSGKSNDKHARLCLQDPGGAEHWVGFRGQDARTACQIPNGADVTCQIERSGEWLNGSNLREHVPGIPC